MSATSANKRAVWITAFALVFCTSVLVLSISEGSSKPAPPPGAKPQAATVSGR